MGQQNIRQGEQYKTSISAVTTTVVHTARAKERSESPVHNQVL